MRVLPRGGTAVGQGYTTQTWMQEAWLRVRCSLGRARRSRPWAHPLCTIVLEPRAERRA